VVLADVEAAAALLFFLLLFAVPERVAWEGVGAEELVVVVEEDVPGLLLLPEPEPEMGASWML